MDSQTLLKLQETEFEILCDIDAFCRKYDIKYSLYAGTALGAVRHKGFIPWDDDIDIAMTRVEYDKFCETWIKTPLSGYYLESILTDDRCGICHAKVRKNNTILLSEGEDENQGHHGIWVDIFPLDKISLAPKFRKKKFKIGRELILLTRSNVTMTTDGIAKKLVRAIVRIVPQKARANRAIKLHKWLVKHMEDGNEAGFEWKSMAANKYIDGYHLNPDLDSGYTQIMFNNICFSVFEKYDEMLKSTFGDYMVLPPEADRVCKHNPIKIQF